MSASISLKIKLGPLVTFEVAGDDCEEICRALKGFQTLNMQIDEMCSDLAERVYPDGEDASQQTDPQVSP